MHGHGRILRRSGYFCAGFFQMNIERTQTSDCLDFAVDMAFPRTVKQLIQVLSTGPSEFHARYQLFQDREQQKALWCMRDSIIFNPNFSSTWVYQRISPMLLLSVICRRIGNMSLYTPSHLGNSPPLTFHNSAGFQRIGIKVTCMHIYESTGSYNR